MHESRKRFQPLWVFAWHVYVESESRMTFAKRIFGKNRMHLQFHFLVCLRSYAIFNSICEQNKSMLFSFCRSRFPKISHFIRRILILKYRRNTCIEIDALSCECQIKVYIPFNFLISYSTFTFNIYVHTQMKVFFRYKKEVSFKSIKILIWKFKNNNNYYYIRLLHISFIHHNLHTTVWLFHRKYQLTCLATKPLMAIKFYIKVKNLSNYRENFIDYVVMQNHYENRVLVYPINFSRKLRGKSSEAEDI